MKCNNILSLSGPLTHTSNEGKTTLYGVTSGPGNTDRGPFGSNNNCVTPVLYSRVSETETLKWIRKYIKKYN